jgi:hypothetical protein
MVWVIVNGSRPLWTESNWWGRIGFGMMRQELDVNVDDTCFQIRHSLHKVDIPVVRYCCEEGGRCSDIRFQGEFYTDIFFENAWRQPHRRWRTTSLQSQLSYPTTLSVSPEYFLHIIRDRKFPCPTSYSIRMVSFQRQCSRKSDLQYQLFYTTMRKHFSQPHRDSAPILRTLAKSE